MEKVLTSLGEIVNQVVRFFLAPICLLAFYVGCFYIITGLPDKEQLTITADAITSWQKDGQIKQILDVLEIEKIIPVLSFVIANVWQRALLFIGSIIPPRLIFITESVYASTALAPDQLRRFIANFSNVSDLFDVAREVSRRFGALHAEQITSGYSVWSQAVGRAAILLSFAKANVVLVVAFAVLGAWIHHPLPAGKIVILLYLSLVLSIYDFVRQLFAIEQQSYQAIWSVYSSLPEKPEAEIDNDLVDKLRFSPRIKWWRFKIITNFLPETLKRQPEQNISWFGHNFPERPYTSSNNQPAEEDG